MILSFRFESLLKLRKSEEYQVHKLFSSINSQLISYKASLELLIENENIIKQNFDQRLQQCTDIKTRRLFDKYFDCQKRRRGIKMAAIEKLTKQLEIKRSELISAIKKTRPLEILKKRHLKNTKKIAMVIENRGFKASSPLCRGQF